MQKVFLYFVLWAAAAYVVGRAFLKIVFHIRSDNRLIQVDKQQP